MKNNHQKIIIKSLISIFGILSTHHNINALPNKSIKQKEYVIEAKIDNSQNENTTSCNQINCNFPFFLNAFAGVVGMATSFNNDKIQEKNIENLDIPSKVEYQDQYIYYKDRYGIGFSHGYNKEANTNLLLFPSLYYTLANTSSFPLLISSTLPFSTTALTALISSSVVSNVTPLLTSSSFQSVPSAISESLSISFLAPSSATLFASQLVLSSVNASLFVPSALSFISSLPPVLFSTIAALQIPSSVISSSASSSASLTFPFLLNPLFSTSILLPDTSSALSTSAISFLSTPSLVSGAYSEFGSSFISSSSATSYPLSSSSAAYVLLSSIPNSISAITSISSLLSSPTSSLPIISSSSSIVPGTIPSSISSGIPSSSSSGSALSSSPLLSLIPSSLISASSIAPTSLSTLTSSLLFPSAVISSSSSLSSSIIFAPSLVSGFSIAVSSFLPSSLLTLASTGSVIGSLFSFSVPITFSGISILTLPLISIGLLSSSSALLTLPLLLSSVPSSALGISNLSVSSSNLSSTSLSSTSLLSLSALPISILYSVSPIILVPSLSLTSSSSLNSSSILFSSLINPLLLSSSSILSSINSIAISLTSLSGLLNFSSNGSLILNLLSLSSIFPGLITLSGLTSSTLALSLPSFLALDSSYISSSSALLPVSSSILSIVPGTIPSIILGVPSSSSALLSSPLLSLSIPASLLGSLIFVPSALLTTSLTTSLLSTLSSFASSSVFAFPLSILSSISYINTLSSLPISSSFISVNSIASIQLYASLIGVIFAPSSSIFTLPLTSSTTLSSAMLSISNPIADFLSLYSGIKSLVSSSLSSTAFISSIISATTTSIISLLSSISTPISFSLGSLSSSLAIPSLIPPLSSFSSSLISSAIPLYLSSLVTSLSSTIPSSITSLLSSSALSLSVPLSSSLLAPSSSVLGTSLILSGISLLPVSSADLGSSILSSTLPSTLSGSVLFPLGSSLSFGLPALSSSFSSLGLFSGPFSLSSIPSSIPSTSVGSSSLSSTLPSYAASISSAIPAIYSSLIMPIISAVPSTASVGASIASTSTFLAVSGLSTIPNISMLNGISFNSLMLMPFLSDGGPILISSLGLYGNMFLAPGWSFDSSMTLWLSGAAPQAYFWSSVIASNQFYSLAPFASSSTISQSSSFAPLSSSVPSFSFNIPLLPSELSSIDYASLASSSAISAYTPSVATVAFMFLAEQIALIFGEAVTWSLGFIEAPTVSVSGIATTISSIASYAISTIDASSVIPITSLFSTLPSEVISGVPFSFLSGIPTVISLAPSSVPSSISLGATTLGITSSLSSVFSIIGPAGFIPFGFIFWFSFWALDIPVKAPIEASAALGAIPVISSVFSSTSSGALSSAFSLSVIGSTPGVLSSTPISASLAPSSSVVSSSALPSFPSISIPSALSYPSTLSAISSGLPLNSIIDSIGLTLGSSLSFTPSGLSGISFFGSNLLYSVLPSTISASNPSYHILGLSSWALPFASISGSLTLSSALPTTLIGLSSLIPSISFNPFVWSSIATSSVSIPSLSLPSLSSVPIASISSSSAYLSSLSSSLPALPSLLSDSSRSTILSSQSVIIPTLISSIGFSFAPLSLISGSTALLSSVPGTILSSSSLSTSSSLLPLISVIPLSSSGNLSSSTNISSYSAISALNSNSINGISSFGINSTPFSLITLPLSWSEISFNISNPFALPGSILVPYSASSLNPSMPFLSSLNTALSSTFSGVLSGIPSVLSSPVFPPSSSITSSYYSSSVPFAVSSSQLPFSPIWSSFAIESSLLSSSSFNPSLSSNLPLIPIELSSLNIASSSLSSGSTIPSIISSSGLTNSVLYSIGKIVQSVSLVTGSAITWTSAGLLSTLFNPSVMVTLSSSSINSLPSYNVAIIAIIAGSSLPSWNTVGSASLLFSSSGPLALSTPSGWSAFPSISSTGSATVPFWFSIGGGIPLLSLIASVGPITLSLITSSLPIHLSASIPGSSTNWSLTSASASWSTSYLNNLSFSSSYLPVVSFSEIQSSSQFSSLLPSIVSSSLPLFSSQIIPVSLSTILASTLLPSSISSAIIPISSSLFAMPSLASSLLASVGLFASIPALSSGVSSTSIYSSNSLSLGASLLSSSSGGLTAPALSAISSSNSIFDFASSVALPSITSTSSLFPSLPSIGSIDSIRASISSTLSSSSLPIVSIPISVETAFLSSTTSTLSSSLLTASSLAIPSIGLLFTPLLSSVALITSIPSLSSSLGAPSLSSQISSIAPSLLITSLSSTLYSSSGLFPINGLSSIFTNLSGFALFASASVSFVSSLTSIPLTSISLTSLPFLIISIPSLDVFNISSGLFLSSGSSSSVVSLSLPSINSLLGSLSSSLSVPESFLASSSAPAASVSLPLLSTNILSSLVSSPVIPSVLPSLSAELPLLSSLAPLSSSSLPSLPVSSVGAPLLSSSILPSSLPLIPSSIILSPISLPLLSSSAPISLPLSISSAPISLPLSSSSAPVSSSLASSLPSSVSILPQASSTVPSVLPLSLGSGVRLSGPKAMKVKSPKNYGYNSYVWRKSNDFEFGNVVTFGDSLSDTGSFGRGSIYMADGNPFVFYNNLISLSMTGKITVPETFGGTNYAVSGAIVKKPKLLDILSDPLSIGRRNVRDQIDWYLDDNGGKADKNSIYLLWIGGNDMTGDIQKILINPFGWRENLTSIHYFNDKPKVAGSYAQLLADQGAGNIIILNLPDPGIAPFTGVAPISATIDSAFMLLDGTKLEWLNIGHYITGLQDKFLRNPANLVGSPIGRSDEYAIENNVNATKSFLPFIPSSLIRGTYELLMKAQRHFVKQWNNDLYERTKQVNGNILFIDTFGLIQELTNDPESYGIDSILVPESTLGYTSPNVDDGDPYYHGKDGKTYMYTDFHHLSGYTHAILAEYILSTFQAPGLITSLIKGLEIDEGARHNFISSQMKFYRDADIPVGQWDIFATLFGGIYKDGRALFNRSQSTQSVGIGASLRAYENIDIGLMLSLGYDDRKPANNLSYKNINETLTLFSQYRKNNIWLNGSLFAGNQQMNDIERLIRLGKKIRTEKGKTSGTTLGFSVEVGYEIPLTNINSKCNCIQYFVNPYIGNTFTKYKVKGYSEKDNNITSMIFGKQKRNINVITTGLQIVGKNDILNTNLDIAYNISNHKDRLSATGQTKNLGTPFNRVGDGLSKNKRTWLSITPNVEYHINDNISIYGNVQYNYSNGAKNTNLNTAIGIKGKF